MRIPAARELMQYMYVCMVENGGPNSRCRFASASAAHLGSGRGESGAETRRCSAGPLPTRPGGTTYVMRLKLQHNIPQTVCKALYLGLTQTFPLPSELFVYKMPSPIMSPPWPNNAKAAISLTMDNLGEPLEIQLGRWPQDGPFGTHESVTKYLPKVLDMLEAANVKGTYFIEAWSLGVYGDTVKEIARRGHEIAWHAYQHEAWARLSPSEEEENFTKSLAIASEFGVKYKGFRPPGGTITQTTRELLRLHGFQYVSHVAPAAAVEEGIVLLPFQWQDIDAFYYEPELSFIRKKFGVQEDVQKPAVLEEHLLDRIRKTIEARGHLAILFHPFLQKSDEKLAVMQKILERISNDPDIWCAPCENVAEWVQGHQDSFTSHETAGIFPE